MRLRAVFNSIAAAAAAILLGPVAPAPAQTYPTRPITIIVPFAPGGGTDYAARVLGPIMSQKIGVAVVVENVSGAAGNIAAQRVSRAEADGYTLLMHNIAFALNAGFNPKTAFFPKDFTPITMINSTPGVLVGRKDLPANSVKELVEYAKKNRLKLGHPGVGSNGHMSVSLMGQALGGLPADLIPYRGGGPALQDVISGQIDITSVVIANGVEPIASGQVKGVGVLSKKRHHLLPNVPSFFEDLNPISESLFWNVLLAPPKTPRAIVDKINAAYEETIKDPRLLEIWTKSGTDL
ncbi:MAG: tripartite tricarboxylate transporter substrate binding protein [Rhizobiales bacterium]|nr:tripartite tricarboxylate transporter substrate binding protein [Hyphomicrobiales bacterium]